MTSSDRDEQAPGRVAVGRINAAWGLQGYVKVTPYTTNPARLAVGSVVLVLGRPTEIADVITPQGYPIVRFRGYSDRNAIDPLLGTTIEIEETELPPLPEGEWYIDEVIGLQVLTTAGDTIGEVTEVLRTGSNDVYIVRRPGKRDALIPALNEIVLEIDVEAKRMVIDPVPGLLD